MFVAAAFFAVAFAPQVPRPTGAASLPLPPPQDLTLPPETANVVTILEARGVQIYTCTAQGSEYRWMLKGPEAQLFNLATGKPSGHHDAGPTWTMDDGSSVRGVVTATKPGPTPADVPWLLLHTDPASPQAAPSQGVLGPVSYVRRYNTHGGNPPAACTSSQVGQEQRVPYSASYAFYSVPGAPSNLQQPPPPPPPPPVPPPPPPAPAQ